MRNVPEGRCDRSLARSAWNIATPNQPSRRVRCDWRRCAHRFDDLESRWYLAVSANGPLHRAAADRNHRTQTLQEEYLAFLKNTAPIATEISLELLRPIRPYPTGRFVRGAPFPGTSCQATIGCPYGTQDGEQKSPKPPLSSCHSAQGCASAQSAEGLATRDSHFIASRRRAV